MSKFKPALGRGLDALINPGAVSKSDERQSGKPENLPNDDGNSVDILVKIPVDDIQPNQFQPRIEFEPHALEELTKSILENGLIQPITVRRISGGKYELISGERRLRACKEIGHKEIPAYIIQVDSKETLLALSLIENIQREDLNPIEIAIAYKRLMDECSLSQDEIAKRVGKNRSTVTNSIRLLKLPKEIQDALIKGEISTGHARAIINIENRQSQLNLFHKITKQNLTVRKVEELVQKLNRPSNRSNIEQKVNSSKDLDTISQMEIENKLRGILGTKVMCKQRKNGAGEVIIEFYSNDELERLFELFSTIENGN